MKTSFIQHKTFDHNLFALYVKNAKQTNHWSNYGETVQTLETRARELLKISEEKIGNGAVAVGLENGHAGFLRFKFRSRTGNGSLDR